AVGSPQTTQPLSPNHAGFLSPNHAPSRFPPCAPCRGTTARHLGKGGEAVHRGLVGGADQRIGCGVHHVRAAAHGGGGERRRWYGWDVEKGGCTTAKGERVGYRPPLSGPACTTRRLPGGGGAGATPCTSS